MNGQQTSDQARVGIGEQLRRAREARGWTLRDVSARIKVTRATVEELENDYVSFHDASVYLRGYRQNYARLLEIGVARGEPGKPPPGRVAVKLRPGHGNHTRVVVEKYSRAATYMLATALVVLSVVAWLQTPFDPAADAGVSVARGGQAGNRAVTAATDQYPDEQSPAALPALPAALTPLHLGGTQSRSLLDTGRANAAPDSGLLPGKLSRLSLTAKADCWVEIQDESGHRIEYDLFHAGERRDYQASGKLHLLFGNAAAITMTVNDQRFDQRPFVNNKLASFNLDVGNLP